ncbi:hypothetical protein D3C87_1701560 [compost metagenome]
MILRSRALIRENCSVRGIGVAVRVNVSTFSLRSLNFSFAATPNFCSSSTINRPRSLNFTSLLSKACVPIRISILPSSSLCNVSFFSLADLKRFR